MLSFAELQSANTPDQQKPWWCDGKVKMQLAKIYYNKGKLEDFVDTIFHPILETLNVEYANRKVHMIFSIYGFHVLLDEHVRSITAICFISTVFIPPFSIASILMENMPFVSFFFMPGLYSMTIITAATFILKWLLYLRIFYSIVMTLQFAILPLEIRSDSKS